MRNSGKTDRKKSILMGIYGSSWGISMISLTIVCVLEICMLIYTMINAPLYGGFIWRYRSFYISLLTVAVIYIFLNLHIKKDIEHRYTILNIANPLCAVFFFVWSLGVTYSDFEIAGVVDPTVFMTFSLVVPLTFYLFPAVYALIVIISDLLMIYLTAAASGSVGALINLFIFFIFQFVLGISFLQLKVKLAERIVEEKENARIDVLTGFPNRRIYTEDFKRFEETSIPDDLIYVAIDINGLKEINDDLGHEAGDKLIIGAAECINQSLGDRGNLYRIGGDEFAVLYFGREGELKKDFAAYEECMKDWSGKNGMILSTSWGYICANEQPGSTMADIARMADAKMYEAKAEYYQAQGRDRRRITTK